MKITIAVAMRDGAYLHLTHSVVREDKGDVYVNFPRPYDSKWKPHSSYHASGQHHQKGHNNKMLCKRRQEPNANFIGTENIVSCAMTVEEALALGIECKGNDYDELFEVPRALLVTHPRALLAFDLAAPNERPIITPGATLLKAAQYRDRVPWILITLFEGPAVIE